MKSQPCCSHAKNQEMKGKMFLMHGNLRKEIDNGNNILWYNMVKQSCMQLLHATECANTNKWILIISLMLFLSFRAVTGHTWLATPVTCRLTLYRSLSGRTMRSIQAHTQRVSVGLGSGQNNVPLSCKQQTGITRCSISDYYV